MLIRSKAFDRLAESVAFRMITGMRTDSAKTWREAASKSTQGAKIYKSLREDAQEQLVQELLQRNIYYIKSAPLEFAERMAKDSQEMSLQGIRPADIAKHLQGIFPTMSKAKSQLIARTESSKAHAALTQSRAQKIGILWYEWETSLDARVRDSHKHMRGVLINYNNPPSPEALIGKKNYGEYNAGEFPNCRCIAMPLIDVDDISWPHKVYWGNRVVMMSKRQFKEIM